MSDGTAAPENTGDPTEPTTSAAPAESTPPASLEPQRVEDLPKWAQEEIRKTRAEAATYRTGKKDLETQLEELNKAVEAAKAEADAKADLEHTVSAREAELGKLRAALKAGIPTDHLDDIASRLKGDTAEEWESDAQSLAALLAPGQTHRRPDPTQGASSTTSTPADQIAAAEASGDWKAAREAKAAQLAQLAKNQK